MTVVCLNILEFLAPTPNYFFCSQIFVLGIEHFFISTDYPNDYQHSLLLVIEIHCILIIIIPISALLLYLTHEIWEFFIPKL